MLTPLVATREVYFVRFSKQLNADKWAIVDVSINIIDKNIDASLARCRNRPSGCVIEDKSNGHCKVKKPSISRELDVTCFFFFLKIYPMLFIR